MRPHAFVLLLALVATGCSAIQSESAGPSDPGYQRTGAPRAGEPALQANNPYGRIMGNDGHSPF